MKRHWLKTINLSAVILLCCLGYLGPSSMQVQAQEITCFNGTQPDALGVGCPPPPAGYVPDRDVCINNQTYIAKDPVNGQCQNEFWTLYKANPATGSGPTPAPGGGSATTPVNPGGSLTNPSAPLCGGADILCIPQNPVCQNGGTGVACSGNVMDLIARVIQILLFFAGIIAVVFVIIGGYMYMTARGNEDQTKKGRQTAIDAIVGLVIVILAYVAVTAVVNFILK